MSASAYDLAVIFRAAMTNQIISAAVQTRTLTLPASNGQPAVQVTNENSLLMGDYSPKYPGEIGGKTGFTSDAQHTYADAAEQNGHRVALIMMRNPNDLPNVYKNAKELLDYGFQLDAAKLPPVGQVVDANPLPGKTTAPSTKDKSGSGVSQADAKAIRAALAPEPVSTFGTVGKPLTILAGVVLLLILVLVLRRKAAKRKRAARAKALVAEKKAADAARAQAAAEAAAAPEQEPEPKPASTVGDTASWAAVDEAFASTAKPSRPTPKRVGTGRPPAPRTNGRPSADADNSTEPTEFFGRIQ
jgi:D-alanyl-D-alanine carboxypeptidase